MIQCLRKRSRNKRGFTLMEVMVVVGIIAVIAGIAIPSVISMQKNMDHKQRCDYAKTIFLAAQSNLADLRSTGELDTLKDNASKAVKQAADEASALPEQFVDRYVYTYHDPSEVSALGTAAVYYDDILPVNSVESVIRDQWVIIEYNPRTGGVYAVFYAEDFSGLVGAYQNGTLKRDDAWCKENQIGYYNGSDRSSEELEFLEAKAVRLPYENGQELVLDIEIPRQDIQNRDLDGTIGTDRYVKGLEINLTVIGENGGMFTKTIKLAGEAITFTQFNDDTASPYIRIPFALDSLISENSFATIEENRNGQGFHVQPGDNVSLMLEVKFVPEKENDPVIEFDDCVLAGINPLFHSLTGDSQNGYTIAISNGRHLQNLNAVAADIAANVKTITFVQEEKQTEGTNKTEEDASNGQKTGSNTKTTNSSTNTAETLEVNWKDTTSYYMEHHPGSNVTYFAPINNAGLFNRTNNTAPEIQGQNVEICNLKINDAKTNNAIYVNPYTLKNNDVGLFRYVSGKINDLRIVNPIIRGGSSSQATGVLAGSMNSAATVTNCYVYVDMKSKDFIGANLILTADFDGSDTTDTKYGVAGYAAVGGMVGDAGGAQFTGCLASVPVFGDMGNLHGSNIGVGGFVGTTNGGSFKKCYSGVRTIGKGAYYEGNIGFACGLGGFVGTSDNGQFTNCFASGDVSTSAGNLDACGGFVGVAKGTYTNGAFNSCYALGTVNYNSTYQAKFVGTTDSYGTVDRYKQILAGGGNYVYDGCYYLEGYRNIENADTDTLPAKYGFLHEIYGISYKEPYIDYILKSLQTTNPNLTDISKLGTAINGSQYNGNWTSGVNSKVNGHHPYMQGYQNANYPYSMLLGMPFYGVWPDPPSDAGIVYVEKYLDGSTGIYYKDQDEATLKNKTVIEDYYMVVCANGGKVPVTFNNSSSPVFIDCDKLETIEGHSYHCGVIPYEIPVSGNFYTKVQLTDGSRDYTMYFNPNTAVSQINPKETGTAAENPGTSVPNEILIRSARQFATMGTGLANFLNNEFVLMGNIDFTQSNYSLPNLGAFSGTLTGDATITVKNMETGLIDTLNGGKMEGITLNVTNGITLEDGEGALVNTMNSGTLSGCTVDARITGTGNAGLMVGSLNGGTISDCHFEGTNSSSLGFVGTAKKLDGSKAIVGNPNYVCSDKVNDGKYTLSDITGRGLSEIETGETLYKQEYAATITSDCKINGTPAVTGKYYYSITGENTYVAAEASAITTEPMGAVALSSFGKDNKDWTNTGYYVEQSGYLRPLYVKVEVNQEEMTVPAVASEVDGADQENSAPGNNTESGSGDGNIGESQPPETTDPVPTYKTIYIYSFAINNDQATVTSIETENPDTDVTSDILYTVNVPTSGDYVLFTERYNPLSAVPVTNFDGTITANMIWTLKDGILINMQDDTVSVKPELVLPVNKNKVTVNVNGTEYTMHTVSEVETRDVKLVDSDVIYSTTKRDAEPSVPADGTDASGSGT